MVADSLERDFPSLIYLKTGKNLPYCGGYFPERFKRIK